MDKMAFLWVFFCASAFLLVLSHLFGSLVFFNTISNQGASSFICAHIDTFFSPIGVFVDQLNRAPGHDIQLTGVQKVSFKNYPLASANHFDFLNKLVHYTSG
jgi:hypothetical protein